MSVTLLNRAVDAALTRGTFTRADVDQFARAVKGGGGVSAEELSAFEALPARFADRFDAAARAHHEAVLLTLVQLPAPPPAVKAPGAAPAPAPAAAPPTVVSWDTFKVATTAQELAGPQRDEAREVMALLTDAVARGVLPLGDDLLLSSAVAQVGFGGGGARGVVERLEQLSPAERAEVFALTGGSGSPLQRAVLYAAFSAGSSLSALATLARSLAGLSDAQVEQVLHSRGSEQLAAKPIVAAAGQPLSAEELTARAAGPLSRLDATGKEQLSAVLESEGFQLLDAREQTRMLALLGGTNRLISAPARAAFARLVGQNEFVMVSAGMQAEALRALVREEAWLPGNIIGLVDLTAAPPVVVRGPFEVAAHVFVAPGDEVPRREQPAHRYDVELDGRTLPVFVSLAELAPGEKRQSPQHIAQVLAALPKPSRASIRSVNLHGERNPRDPAWEQRFQIPGFRSAMTAAANGTVDIYPLPLAEPDGQLLHELVHETGHVLSVDAWARASSDPRWFAWKAAAVADGISASKYARENWEEDFGETLTLLERVRGTEAEAEVRAMMPGRLALLDGLWA